MGVDSGHAAWYGFDDLEMYKSLTDPIMELLKKEPHIIECMEEYGEDGISRADMPYTLEVCVNDFLSDHGLQTRIGSYGTLQGSYMYLAYHKVSKLRDAWIRGELDSFPTYTEVNDDLKKAAELLDWPTKGQPPVQHERSFFW